MIWFNLFIMTILFNILHNHYKLVEDINISHNHHNFIESDWIIFHYKFLWRVTLESFFWYFIPDLLFPALSIFAFITWIFPCNIIINQMFEMIMSKNIKNNISQIENNFLSCRQEIGIIFLVKVGRDHDFYNHYVH